ERAPRRHLLRRPTNASTSRASVREEPPRRRLHARRIDGGVPGPRTTPPRGRRIGPPEGRHRVPGIVPSRSWGRNHQFPRGPGLAPRHQLEAQGHEVVVVAPEGPRRRGKREPGTIYVRAKEFRHYPGYRLAMFPGRETDLIKEMGIDVIHIHGVGFVGIKGIWASWQAKVPRVSTFHTMIHETLAFY